MSSSSSKNTKMSAFGGGGSSSSKLITKLVASSAATPHSPDVDAPTEVNIPIIRNKDNAKQLPVYYSAMQRTAEDYVAIEDLDHIQLELETLLSSVAMRYRVLKSEYDNLDKDERRNERRSKHSSGGDRQPSSPASTGKRKRDEQGSVRKSKHYSTSSSSQKHGKKHSKNSPAPHTDDSMDYAPSSSHGTSHGSHGQVREHIPKVTLPKNDTLNKFWLSIEPYCMPVTNEDLRLLDDLLDQYNGPLVPPIPELGPHYSDTWAEEDLKDLQQASNPNSKCLKQQNNAPAAMLKKAESLLDQGVTGPLTQRLVSALLEEQLIPNPGDFTAQMADNSNSSSENTHSSSQLNFRSLSLLRNGIGIEKRLKRELFEQGLLDISDFPNEDEDEIYSEIGRLVNELSTIADYNKDSLQRLRESATEEIKRLEIKRKLDSIDQEILETYKRTMQNKSKRKSLSNEEQQEIFRLTSEQKALSEELERSQPNGYFFE